MPKAKAKRSTEPETESNLVAFRAEPELLAAIDAEVERVRADRPGVRVSRSSVAREMIGRALLSGEKGGKPPRKAK